MDEIGIRVYSKADASRDSALEGKGSEGASRMYRRWRNNKARKQREYEEAVNNLKSKGII